MFKRAHFAKIGFIKLIIPTIRLEFNSFHLLIGESNGLDSLILWKKLLNSFQIGVKIYFKIKIFLKYACVKTALLNSDALTHVAGLYNTTFCYF